MVKIIPNKAEYLDQLVELVEEYREFCGFSRSPEITRNFFQMLLETKEAVTFLAVNEEAQLAMGFVNLYPSYSTLSRKRLWILNDLGVGKHYQGRGVAKQLIKEVISFAQKTNAIRIELKTQKSNTGAQRLYKSLGFVIDAENIYYRVPA